MKTILANEKQFTIIQNIARTTWPVTFGAILSAKQIDYMLEMMYSNEALTEQVNKKKHVFLLVKEQEEFLGYVSYELNYKGLSKTKIHKIYLLPSAQGKGAGKFLIQHVSAIARENKNQTLTLNVNRDNKAVQFYEAQGFIISGKENINIGEGFLMEDFIMDKSLD